MTAAILPFVGRSTLAARENLLNLIEKAQSHGFFAQPDGVLWPSSSWNLDSE